MPLRDTEVCQCPCCEEYSRLGELVRVKTRTASRGFSGEEVITNKSDQVGYCPYCHEPIYVRHIT